MSQTLKLMDYLTRHPDRGHPLTRLGRLIGAWAVHSRIAEVRRLLGGEGRIENRKELRNGKVRSYYRLT
jgi:hypothetical protein